MEVINEAYRLELGDTGLSFKNRLRFRNMGEVEAYLDYFYILREKSNGPIVGAIGAKLVNDFKMVSIGPLGVHPEFQVNIVGKENFNSIPRYYSASH